jgi:hypothetical protein
VGLAKLGDLVTLIGKAPIDAAAHIVAIESVQVIIEALGKNDTATDQNASQLMNKYSENRDALPIDKKLAAIQKIQGKLSAEISDEIKKKARPTGDVAKSESASSVNYDSSTGLLSFANDKISGLSSDAPDTILGADVRLPSYLLQAKPSWGSPGMSFFVPETEANVTVGDASSQYLASNLLSLIYSADTNTFYGILLSMSSIQGGSDFVAELQAHWWNAIDSDLILFPMIEITPFVQFDVLTNNFSVSGESSFNNAIAAFIPEPSSFILTVTALLGLIFASKQKLLIRINRGLVFPDRCMWLVTLAQSSGGRGTRAFGCGARRSVFGRE